MREVWANPFTAMNVPAGVQARAFAGHVVHTIKSSAANAATNQTVTCFHVFHATARITETDSAVLRSKRRVKAG